MAQFLKIRSILFVLTILAAGCNLPSQPALTDTPAADPAALVTLLLAGEEINAADLLAVGEDTDITGDPGCLPEDCAMRVWEIGEPGAPGLTVSGAPLQLSLSLRRFESAADASAYAEEIIRQNGGQPGIQMMAVAAETLPEQSWAFAEDGRRVDLICVYENFQLGVSLSQSTGGINDTEQAAALLANLAEMQVEKLVLAGQK